LSLGVPGCSLTPHPVLKQLHLLVATQINPTAQRFDGVTINVITHDEAIHTGTQRRIAGFEALTGAKVNLTGVPFKNLYTILAKQLVW
jgi:multiple sugar transport system substrate-binding protein